MDRRIDCGTCGRKARGPWSRHATTDAHRRNGAPKVTRVAIAKVRREVRGGIAYKRDPWSSDDGRDWDAEQQREQE